MKNTYLNIVQLFEQFATKHLDVKRFRSGTLDEFPNFSNEAESFPILYSVLQNQKINNYKTGYKSITFLFDIYCVVPRVDVFPEENDIILLNQNNNNFNQTSKVLNDLYKAMEEMNNFDFLTEINIQPIHNYLCDFVEGMYASFEFEVDYDFCILPMTSPLVNIGDIYIPIDPVGPCPECPDCPDNPECPDINVNLINNKDLLVDQIKAIPCGGDVDHYMPDIQILTGDGLLNFVYRYDVIDMNDFTRFGGGCAQATVHNEYWSWVANINSGDSLQIPSSQINVDNSLVTKLPATEYMNIFIKDKNNNDITTEYTNLNTNFGYQELTLFIPDNTPQPSGIRYIEPNINSLSYNYVLNFDCGWRRTNNRLINNDPINPLYTASLVTDYSNSPVNVFETLFNPNIFGNNNRFTDVNGNLAYPVYDTMPGVGNRFYDHLTGREYMLYDNVNDIEFQYALFFGDWYLPTVEELMSLKNIYTDDIRINGNVIADKNSNFVGNNFFTGNVDPDTYEIYSLDNNCFPVERIPFTSETRYIIYVRMNQL